MTNRTSQPWILKGAAAVLAAEVLMCVPVYVDAASTAATATVRVLPAPAALQSVTSLTATIPLAPPPTTTSTAATTAADQADTAQPPANRSVASLIDGAPAKIAPAVFSISGSPGQTFAIVVPKSGTLHTELGDVQISDFAHSAGGTPVIGANGSSSFEIGATVRLDVRDFDLDLNTASGDNTAAPDAADAETPPKAAKLGMPRPNPFGMLGPDSGFMMVSVSYN